MKGAVLAILWSVAGGVIVLAGQYLVRALSEYRGGYTGIWEDAIFDDAGSIIKRDRVYLRQRGEQVRGWIERLFPAEETHRRWRLYGRIRGQDFFATFWSVDVTVRSYGSFDVHQITDDSFAGYYLRVSEKDHRAVAPDPRYAGHEPGNGLLCRRALRLTARPIHASRQLRISLLRSAGTIHAAILFCG